MAMKSITIRMKLSIKTWVIPNVTKALLAFSTQEFDQKIIKLMIKTDINSVGTEIEFENKR